MEGAEFRRILGHFASGVAIVATRDAATGLPLGLTANAVASVSIEPALVLACVAKDADTHDRLQAYGRFSINILTIAQERLARRFATWEQAEKFTGVGFRTEVTGAPVLEDVLAWVDCTVWATYPGGDHTIYVGKVAGGDAQTGGTPLLYYRGGYGRFSP
jgi:flavin reductase (DIM6/NTAB) family NADH-FMN oxidoreductase RutF